MGIENFCAHYIKTQLGYELPNCVSSLANKCDYITLSDFDNVSEWIYNKEKMSHPKGTIIATIYAGCLSHSLWGLSPIYDRMSYVSTSPIVSDENLEFFIDSSPKLIIMSLLHELAPENFKDISYETIINRYEMFFKKYSDKKILWIIPHELTFFDNVRTPEREMSIRIFDYFKELNVEKLTVIHTGDFGHLNRNIQHTLSAEISQWVIDNS